MDVRDSELPRVHAEGRGAGDPVTLPQFMPGESFHRQDTGSEWKFFGREVPKSEIVFVTQTLILYIVIIVCLVNLSVGKEPSNLWTALLSSSLGYMLPNPTLKRDKKRV